MTTGQVTSYDLTVGVKINMDEAIYVLSPLDSPMLTGVDSDGLSVIGSAPLDQVEFTWQDEELLIPRSSVGGAVITADTSITLASADDRLKFSTGDVIRMIGGNEVVRVTGYSATTAAAIVVTRGFDGTTAQSYAAGALVIGLGTALPEGSDPEDARSQDRSTAFNVAQIFGPTKVHMSGTEQVISKYGVPNEMARQLYNRTRENVIAREQAYVYGRRYNSTTTEIRTTGGLDYFIQSNVDTTSTQLTVTSLTGVQQDAYDRGGVWDRIMANPKSLADLDAVGDTDRVRQEFADSRRGRQPVMTVYTEYGALTVVRNRWVAPVHAFGFSRENVVRRVLRSFQAERLAKTGDSDSLQILCEEGLEVKGEEHMAKFSGLTYAN